MKITIEHEGKTTIIEDGEVVEVPKETKQPKYEKGWYKSSFEGNEDLMMFCDGENIKYGITSMNKWVVFERESKLNQHKYKVSTKEAYERLTEFFKSKGYVKGVKVKCLEDGEEYVIRDVSHWYVLKDLEEDNEYWAVSDIGVTICLMKEGKLAEIVEEEFHVKVGDRFWIEGDEFILAQTVSFMICLVCLDNGNRWQDSIKVNDLDNITKEEFNEITFTANTEEVYKTKH